MNIQCSKGFTAIELMVTLAIVAIVSGIGVPSFQKMMERNRLKQAVESLKSDLLLARTEAIKRSRNVLVSRTTGNDGNWCYGLSTTASCNCTQTSVAATDFCDIKRVSGADLQKINMDAAAQNNSTFDFRRGTVGANGVTFSSDNFAARVVFSNVGRVRVCTPVGATGLSDFPDC